MLVAGGWVHLGPVTIPAAAAAKYAAFWGVGFLLVGFFEEGEFRCYLQFTLTRGINFWWALAALPRCVSGWRLPCRETATGAFTHGAARLFPLLHPSPEGCSTQGRILAGGLGYQHLFRLYAHRQCRRKLGWHLAAAAIGFVFCVSVRVTGSAWWAIGCHAAWDWAETYFYGAADSGRSAGTLLSAAPAGNPLLSGGADGPEGSLLGLPLMVLLGVLVLVLYARRRSSAFKQAS